MKHLKLYKQFNENLEKLTNDFLENDGISKEYLKKDRYVIKFEQFINEETDYRDVTGLHGTEGQISDQKTGTAFNKSGMSVLFNQPEVLGTDNNMIKDPYFNKSKQKTKRIKKNRKLKQLRKNNSDKLKNLDIEYRKKLIDKK